MARTTELQSSILPDRKYCQRAWLGRGGRLNISTMAGASVPTRPRNLRIYVSFTAYHEYINFRAGDVSVQNSPSPFDASGMDDDARAPDGITITMSLVWIFQRPPLSLTLFASARTGTYFNGPRAAV